MWILATVLITLFMTLVLGVSLKALESKLSKSLNSSPKKYDINYTRKLELENFGEYRTPLPEGEKPKALPKGPAPGAKPPKGPGGVSKPYMTRHCHRCMIRLGRDSSDTCQKCTQQVLEERRRKREFEKAKLLAAKRVRHVEFFGSYYEARIPDGVPDNAHLEIVNQGLDASFATWAYWKWTDETTGKPMGLKSTAFALGSERYEVWADQSSEPINYLYTGM